MDGLVVAKQQYTVCLINIELNQRFSQFKLKNITAHGIFAEYRHRYGAALEMRDVDMDSDMHGGSRSVDGHRSHFFLKWKIVLPVKVKWLANDIAVILGFGARDQMASETSLTLNERSFPAQQFRLALARANTRTLPLGRSNILGAYIPA